MTKDKKEDFLHSKKFNHFLHDEEQRLKSSVIKLFAVFFLILIGLNSLQLFRLSHAFNKVDQYNQGVVDEVGEMKQGLMTFGNDLNEIRNYLYLPTRDYFTEAATKEAEQESDSESSSETSQALYKLLGDNLEKKQKEKDFKMNCEQLKTWHANEDFLDSLKKSKLSTGEKTENENTCSFKVIRQDQALFNLLVSFNQPGGMMIQSLLGEVKIDQNEDMEEEVQDYFSKNAQKIFDLKAKLEKQKSDWLLLIEKEELKSLFNEKQITLDANPTETPEGFTYAVKSLAGEILAQVWLERETADFKLGEDEFATTQALEPKLKSALKKLNEAPAPQEDSTKKAREELETIFKERAFQDLLKQNQFLLNPEPREEQGRFFYDVKMKSGELAFSLALDPGSGEYKLIQNGQEIDLLSILQPNEEEKKNLKLPEILPEYGDTPRQAGEQLNVLIAGKHGSLVDTMIVVNINPKTQRISMVSVPRDLYWNGRKINSVYALYGMEELLRVLSKISGYQINHYALIDMYAFIDVVDLLGGIDVTLEKTLIDPTYKTLDNGVWGTLYYPAGTYHLSGKQSLRIARSRHTSSDFDRAARQHIILESLKNKAKELGLKDAGTLKKMAEATLKHTETNLNPAQAMAYYFRFKDFALNKGYVLTSGNVLESTFTGEMAGAPAPNCTTNEAGEEVCQKADRGAYILLPRGGNWNNIKWFFEQAFEKEGEEI